MAESVISQLDNPAMPAEGFEHPCINELPLEIFTKILQHLPQDELIRIRTVCKHWAETIEKHLTFKVHIDDKRSHLFNRITQLRINTCIIRNFQEDRDILTYPNLIQTLSFAEAGTTNVVNTRRLLRQTKPYIQHLSIKQMIFENENILSQPYKIPLLTKLTISLPEEIINFERSLNNLNTLFSHRMPLLQDVKLKLTCHSWTTLNTILIGFLKFIGTHRLNIKTLHVDFLSQGLEDPGVGANGQLEIPNAVKTLVYNSDLQLKNFYFNLPTKYISVLSPIIRNQKDLIHFKASWNPSTTPRTTPLPSLAHVGIPYNKVHPAISASIQTLRILELKDILSIQNDARTWIPLDCGEFENAINLCKLILHKSIVTGRLDANFRDLDKRGEIINISKIPLGRLEHLEIKSFVCDSAELQNLVDAAPSLATLILENTGDPFSSSRYANTGVHGGIIKSFVDKDFKKFINVSPINYYGYREHCKLIEITAMHPEMKMNRVWGHFYAFKHTF